MREAYKSLIYFILKRRRMSLWKVGVQYNFW